MKVYTGIGSNLGNRFSNIKKAVSLIGKKCKILKISPIYETEPIGYKNQPWFLNCVVKIEAKIKPLELLHFLKSIEIKMKREKTIKNGPRIIDLDILFYGNKLINSKELIIPHPRLRKRLFVLEPLCEISPNLVHPKLKKTVRELKNKIKNQKISLARMA